MKSQIIVVIFSILTLWAVEAHVVDYKISVTMGLMEVFEKKPQTGLLSLSFSTDGTENYTVPLSQQEEEFKSGGRYEYYGQFESKTGNIDAKRVILSWKSDNPTGPIYPTCVRLNMKVSALGMSETMNKVFCRKKASKGLMAGQRLVIGRGEWEKSFGSN
ncbi:uncharacterized protein LOC141858052 [Brevipalpus obovatus]|uniref:uncharacterized protein LOC141858052 n=1 Tax=Brevipalpus obovatus TaxID=246614 RepID=UPI003D9F9345